MGKLTTLHVEKNNLTGLCVQDVENLTFFPISVCV